MKRHRTTGCHTCHACRDLEQTIDDLAFIMGAPFLACIVLGAALAVVVTS